jgi:hypothetical protein
MFGPIDYVAVGFKGNNFDGSILSELAKAVDSGVIRVIDLILIIKGEDGNVAAAEIDDQDDDIKAAAKTIGLSGDMPLLTEEDVTKFGSKMENNSSAGLLVIEQLWAKGLKKALQDAGGVLLADGRIHSDVVEAAAEELKEVKG